MDRTTPEWKVAGKWLAKRINHAMLGHPKNEIDNHSYLYICDCGASWTFDPRKD